MYEVIECPSLVGYTNDNGEKGYYKTWRLDIDGDLIAAQYHELNMTPKQVEGVINEVSELIGDAIWEAIDREVSERFK